MTKPSDYLAAFFADPEKDKVDYGVPGMKWGIRKDKSDGKSSKKDESPKEAPKASSSLAPQVFGAASGETSGARYARLAQDAKSGQAHNMSEQDLKFFNARTEALTKINKLNEAKPSWLADTAKKVVQQTAQNQMQAISDGVAKKYISGPILDGINGAAAKAAAPAAKSAAKELTSNESSKEAAKAVIKEVKSSIPTPATVASKAATKLATIPVGVSKQYGPSGNKDLFKALRDAQITKK